MLAALKDAGQHPDGVALYRVGKNPGLFASKTGIAHEAAQAAMQAGYLTPVKVEGKAETVRLTSRGEAFLREHLDPKASVEELLAHLRATQHSLPRWLAEVDAQLAAFRLRMQTSLEQQGKALTRLIGRAEAALQRLEHGVQTTKGKALEPWQVESLQLLEGAQGVTPLARLFSELQRNGFGELTIPIFHTGLLLLRDRGNLQLVAMTEDDGPLSEPEFALVDEGQIYLSARAAE